MSRQSNIRWRKSDTAELRRVVKNYNARIRYHRTRDPSFTGTTLSFKEVKASISTRSEFKSAIKNIEAVRESSKQTKRTRAESFISSRISNRPKPISTSKVNSRPIVKQKSKAEPEVKVEQPTESKNKELELEKPTNKQEDKFEDKVTEHEDKFYDYYEYGYGYDGDSSNGTPYESDIEFDFTFGEFYTRGDLWETAQGIEIPNDIRIEIETRLKSVNDKRKERYEEHSQLVSTEKGTMGRLNDIEYLPKPNRLDNLKSKEEIRDYLSKLRYWDSDQYEKDMQEQYLTNYMKALENNGFENWQLDHIEELIEKLGIKNFIDLSYVDPRVEVNYTYTKEEIDYKYEQICTALEQGKQALADAKSN